MLKSAYFFKLKLTFPFTVPLLVSLKGIEQTAPEKMPPNSKLGYWNRSISLVNIFPQTKLKVSKATYQVDVDVRFLALATESQLEHFTASNLNHDSGVKLEYVIGRHLHLDGRQAADRSNSESWRDDHAWYWLCIMDLSEDLSFKLQFA